MAPFRLLLSMCIILVGLSAAAPRGPAEGSVRRDESRADFDGDGYEDLAVGAPGETFGGVEETGVVHVLYGSAGGVTAVGDQVWAKSSPGIKDAASPRDRFGSSLASGDLDGDGFDDLAIATQETVGGETYAGGVHVIYGAARGLTARGDQFFTQETAGIRGKSRSSGHFGSALEVGDFNGDLIADLAISVWDRKFGGAVHVLYGASSGLSAFGGDYWHREVPGIKGGASYGGFGGALAAGSFDGDAFDDLAIGSSEVAGGSVHVLYGSPEGLTALGDQLFSQDTPGVKGVADAYEDDDEPEWDTWGRTLVAADFDGDGHDDLGIGNPAESVGPHVREDPDQKRRVGMVHVLYGSPRGLTARGDQLWHQDAPGVKDDVESLDDFGEGLATGDFDADGLDDLAIGVPGEEGDGLDRDGAVHVLYGSPRGLSARDQLWRRTDDSTARVVEGGRIGDILGAVDGNGDGASDLLVGASSESTLLEARTGVAYVIEGSAGGLSPEDTVVWSQDSPGVRGNTEEADRFGASVGTATDG